MRSEKNRASIQLFRKLRFGPYRRRDWRSYYPDLRFFGPEDFVLHHGRYWRGQPLPENYRAGKMGRCGINATRLARRRADLIFVEGYAVPFNPVGTELLGPLGHAWVVDGEGRVIDPTWPAGAREYFGVPFRHAYVARLCAKSPQSTLIERWREEFPLLRKGMGLPTRVWKESRFDGGFPLKGGPSA
jgi:hypothetical protein